MNVTIITGSGGEQEGFTMPQYPSPLKFNPHVVSNSCNFIDVKAESLGV
jgi:hypothetical protein